ALLRGSDAFLQLAHLRRERRLVAHGARHASEQGGYLGNRLRAAEDVVDEDQEVSALLVAEVFRDGETGERDAEARAWRLVHLTEDHRHLVDDPRFLHFAQELGSLA